LAVAEAKALVDVSVRFLGVGSAAWKAAGYALSTGFLMADNAR
jgi:hypothetical protein